MRHLIIPFLFVMTGILAACSDKKDTEPGSAPSAIGLSAKTLEFTSQGGTAAIEVTTNGEWDAACTETWVSLVKSGTLTSKGNVEVTVAPNNGRKDRTATITFLSGPARESVTITQTGKAAEPVDPTINIPDGYELVWNDEFDGNFLNTSDWKHEVQSPGWVNNELQTYVNGSYDGLAVTEVVDGILHINCFKHAGKIYSGRIYAKVNTGWKYGIFEASIKLPKGRGTWPAFWMMPVNVNWETDPWPRCGEIDIMEEVGYHANYTSSSIHCQSYNHMIGTQRTAERFTSGAEDDFHVYRLEWTADYIRTYVDGNPLLYFPNDGQNNVSTWPFAKPFYLILNLAWGGDWGGQQGVDEGALPATMQVDWVRVFQKIE